jgi:hypothetical protein
MSLTQLADADGEYYEVKESVRIPSTHCDIEESPDNIPLTKDILSVINNLLEQHKFAKNYDPKRLVTDLEHQGVSNDNIPSQKQLQNHLTSPWNMYLSCVFMFFTQWLNWGS